MLGPARHLGQLAGSAVTRRRQGRDDADALRELEASPLGLPAGLELEWLGVSGYRITFEDHTLYLDPYVSRVPLRSLLLRRPAVPDAACVERFLPAAESVVGVLVGHTHFDHAVDAPALARRFGCHAYGSASLAVLMRLHGLGELTCDHLDGMAPSAYRCGQVWGIRIAVGGITFYHQGSADLVDDAVRARDVDVFLAGVAGRSFTKDYWKRILPRLDPRVVVPTHYDNFFRPLGDAMDLIGNLKLAELPRELAAASADVRLAALPRLPSAAADRSGQPGVGHVDAGREEHRLS